MGILAGHIPSILQLRPGALVVIPGAVMAATTAGNQGGGKGGRFFAERRICDNKSGLHGAGCCTGGSQIGGSEQGEGRHWIEGCPGEG